MTWRIYRLQLRDPGIRANWTLLPLGPAGDPDHWARLVWMLSVPAYRKSQDIKIRYVPIAGSSIDTEARSTASRYQTTKYLDW